MAMLQRAAAPGQLGAFILQHVWPHRPPEQFCVDCGESLSNSEAENASCSRCLDVRIDARKGDPKEYYAARAIIRALLLAGYKVGVRESGRLLLRPSRDAKAVLAAMLGAAAAVLTAHTPSIEGGESEDGSVRFYDHSPGYWQADACVGPVLSHIDTRPLREQRFHEGSS